MRRISALLLLGLFIFGYAPHASARAFTATVCVDNYYVLAYGNEDGSDLHQVGASLEVAWYPPQTWAFEAGEDDYLYVAAWGDGSVSQGFIAQFVSESGMILTEPVNWEVYSTYKPFPYSASSVASDISTAVWSPIRYSLINGSQPWGILPQISADARWIWAGPLQPGSTTGEYHLFRTRVSQAPYYPPVADAGEDVSIYLSELGSTVIEGSATYSGTSPLQYRWICGEYVLLDWTPVGPENECFMAGSEGVLPPGTYSLVLEVSDGLSTVSDTMILTVMPDIAVPTISADAGPNIALYSENVAVSTIYGRADYTGTGALSYRWVCGQIILLGWTPVGPDNECLLTSQGSPMPLGTYPLTLEVTDGEISSADTMILTVNNSSPHAAILGGAGIYEIGTGVVLSVQVSDFDGDLIEYTWLEGDEAICAGYEQSVYAGSPVRIPDCVVSGLSLGMHTLTLEVCDGVNGPVITQVAVDIVDSSAPSLAPFTDTAILWPPNHKMVTVVIDANAYDNSGMPVILSATVMSNEPQDGLGDGDTAPDWTEPVIDQEAGTITLQLRAERSGAGEGREYTVTIDAEDSFGNRSSAELRIIVPHDKGKS